MAFLAHKDKLFFTLDSKRPLGTLLEGIWTHFSSEARCITRNRIFTHLKPTPLCEGMVKVVGKRFSVITEEDYQVHFNEYPQKNRIEIFSPGPMDFSHDVKVADHALTDEEAISLAGMFAQKSKSRIGSVLLDQKGRFVSGGWNDHCFNKILHAEIMMIKSFQSKTGLDRIPSRYRIYSTLQPCAMCAGYLYEFSESFHSLQIHFAEPDPGPFAQNSILVKNSHLWKKLYA